MYQNFKGMEKRKFTVNIISREEWGARPPKEGATIEPVVHPVENVIFSYDTKTDMCYYKDQCSNDIRVLQKKFLDEGHDDIPYNFIVGGDMYIYEGRGWNLKPEKNSKFPDIHDSSIDIGFMGDYRCETVPMSISVLAMNLVNSGIFQNYVFFKYELHERWKELDMDEVMEAIHERPRRLED